MAWGSSKPKTPPPPPSALSKILPLLLTLIVLGAIAFIGFNVWIMATAIADRTSQKLEKKNVIFTKDGMKVGVKEVKDEALSDRSQRYNLNCRLVIMNPAHHCSLVYSSRRGTFRPGLHTKAACGIRSRTKRSEREDNLIKALYRCGAEYFSQSRTASLTGAKVAWVPAFAICIVMDLRHL